MTESKTISHQYHKIISELQKLNPNENLEAIKYTLHDCLFRLFVDEIVNLEFLKDITLEKIKKDVIKQRLQSTRQPLNLREAKVDMIKKEKKYFKLKVMQNSLKRNAFYNSLDYPGTFSRKELFYINHSDQTLQSSTFFENLDKYDNQETFQEITEEDKTSVYKQEKVNDFNEIDIDSLVDFPEIQETIDIFRKFEEIEEKFEEEKAPKIELEMELRKRILKLNLKPIEKKQSEDLNLLDYIGFVDNNENETKQD